jgi:hypothetical protein
VIDLGFVSYLRCDFRAHERFKVLTSIEPFFYISEEKQSVGFVSA